MLLKKLIRFYLNRLRRLDVSPSFFDSMVLKTLYPRTRLNFTATSTFSVRNFLSSNSIPVMNSSCEDREDSLHVLIPFTQKDIPTLRLCLDGAAYATSHYSRVRFTLISDQRYQLEHLGDKFEALDIKIITDEEFLGQAFINQVKSQFSTRAGWLLQQIIKIEFAAKCSENLQLAIDSDTILLKKQEWCDSGGRQILFESEEFHPPYYDFLSKVGFKDLNSSSHITHHMIYQPYLVQRMLLSLEINSLSDYFNLLKKRDSRFGSFVSIDYEAYAQFLVNKFPDSWVPSKWSNLPLAREAAVLDIEYTKLQSMFPNYNSVSFHDWYK